MSMKKPKNKYWLIVYKKLFFFYVDFCYIIWFFQEWIINSILILKNIKKDTKKYNLSLLVILYNALLKYPLLGFIPIDFFCYKLYKNNYKKYISFLKYYYTFTRENFYLPNSISDKFIFKQILINKIKTPKILAYYDHKNTKIIKFAKPSSDKVVIKPSCGYRGNGIQIVKSDNYINNLKKCKQSSIAEEFIEQHQMLNDIFSEVVNTLRIITLKKNGDFIIIKGTLKVGQYSNIYVDNVAKGGIGININLKTGILGRGYTSYKHGFIEYKYHPKSNYKFYGKSIPYIDQVKDLAISAHRYFPRFKIIGWDIAITETGPTIVEGNIHPNITGMQLHEPLLKKLSS